MQQTFHVTERGELLTVGVIFSAVGALFTVLGLMLGFDAPVFRGNMEVGNRIFAAFVFTGTGVLGAYVGLDMLFRRAWHVEIHPDGHVNLRCAIRVRTVLASHIVALDRSKRRVGLEGEDARLLKLIHKDGTVCVPWFPEMENLIEAICALNPGIVIRGWWASADS